MEQYLDLIWKNYTALRSENVDDEDKDASDLFAHNDLHYQIPFWIGVIVISLLLLSAIIGTIRYCIHTLCSSNMETEKVALMPPTSPCLSAHTIRTSQRQRSKPMIHHGSDGNETSTSSPEQLRDHRSNISIIPINRQYCRPELNSSRHHQMKLDTGSHHYFSPNESRTPVNFRKKMHDIYVLPVSPAFSSSSSTTNTDEMIRTSSKTMSTRSRRQTAASANLHHDSTHPGIKNDGFTDSPQLKNRTLARSDAGTLRRVQPPTQPPPLPPTISRVHDDQSSFHHGLFNMNPDSDTISLQIHSIDEKPTKKTIPPPVPCRSQKHSRLSLDFKELTQQPDKINFQCTTKSSPQNDYSEHAWPNPPESMLTSQLSGSPSIPYDHLLPNVIMHQNSTTKFLHQYRHDEHSMLTESDT